MRREDTITACSSIDELLDWATEQRPAGAFTGRENRGFYPFEVPTIHRIHQNEAHASHSVHLQHGMSIQFESLVGRLEELNDAAKTWNDECLATVTFDDGWADVLLLEETFDEIDKPEASTFHSRNPLLRRSTSTPSTTTLPTSFRK